jgi:hypothetical protein
VITPSSGKQDTGWVQEYPPLQYFNWLGKYTYEWLNYLERNTDASLGGGGPLVGLEIAIGVILPTTGNHRIDTQGFAATDDLTNINISNLADGRILILRSTSAARVITVKHAAGGSYPINLRNSADIVLDDPRKTLVLIRNGNQWDELFSFVGSDPAPYLSADLDVQAKKITTTTVDGDIIIEPNGTGSLSPLTAHKAFGKTGTRWGSAFIRDVSVTDWVRTAALDTETLGATLAIGGTNASIINIGRVGATVAIYGSATEVHTTNTFVTDKLLTLNDGGLAASGDGAGIEIEEGGSATGYFKVASNRNKWSFKAPNDAAVVSIGAEATVVGDIGLVSSVFTFMSNGFSWKNSAGTVIGSATDTGAHTWGPLATYDAIDHMLYGQFNIRSTTDASLHFYEGSTKRWTIKCTGSNNGFDFTYAPTGSMGGISAAGAWTLGDSTTDAGSQHTIYTSGTNIAEQSGGGLKLYAKTTTNPGYMFIGWDTTNSAGLIRAFNGASGAGPLNFVSYTTKVGGYSNEGAWTLGPASGLTSAHIIQNTNTGDYALRVKSLGTGANSGGLKVQAGDGQASQVILTCTNAADSVNYFTILGTGSTTIGPSTGSTTVQHTFYSYEDSSGGILIYNRYTTANTGGLASPCVRFNKGVNNDTTSNNLLTFAINGGATASGRIAANGASAAAFQTFSDVRLKENIKDLPSQLQKICSLRPVEFDYKKYTGKNPHQIGFIAQEMQAVYPEAVGNNENNMLTITGWGKTEAYLVKAIQELYSELLAIKSKVA